MPHKGRVFVEINDQLVGSECSFGEGREVPFGRKAGNGQVDIVAAMAPRAATSTMIQLLHTS